MRARPLPPAPGESDPGSRRSKLPGADAARLAASDRRRLPVSVSITGVRTRCASSAASRRAADRATAARHVRAEVRGESGGESASSGVQHSRISGPPQSARDQRTAVSVTRQTLSLARAFEPRLPPPPSSGETESSSSGLRGQPGLPAHRAHRAKAAAKGGGCLTRRPWVSGGGRPATQVRG